MTLDIPTLLAMTLVNFALATAGAAFLWHANRPVVGLGHIAGGIATVFGGFAVTFFLKPFLGTVATGIGNITQVAGIFVFLYGIRLFRGKPVFPWWAAACFAAPFVLGQSWFLFVHNDDAMRAAILSPLTAILLLAAAWSIVAGAPKTDRLIYTATAFALVLYSAAQFARGVEALLPGFGAPALAAGTLPALCFITLNICLVGCTFGVSTATNSRLRERIEKLAFCDALTGLPNRRAFDSRLDQVHTRSIATGSPVALFYIDVDRFKGVNDRFGHSGGDAALKHVAQRLRNVAHPDDCFARMGGDEFVLITERFPSRQAAKQLAALLNQSLLEPIDVQGTLVVFSISCGLAFYPDDVSNTADLIREADAEMYIAKRAMPSRR
jgi:diguanylate cyclase (GGDEF)-like protein